MFGFSLLPTQNTFGTSGAYYYTPKISYKSENVFNINSKTLFFDVTKSYYYVKDIPGIGKLNKDLKLNVYANDSFFIVESKELKISDGGSDFMKALDNFYQYLVDDYKSWIEENDDNLTEKAIELKNKYFEYIGK